MYCLDPSLIHGSWANIRVDLIDGEQHAEESKEVPMLICCARLAFSSNLRSIGSIKAAAVG